MEFMRISSYCPTDKELPKTLFLVDDSNMVSELITVDTLKYGYYIVYNRIILNKRIDNSYKNSMIIYKKWLLNF